MSNVGASHVTVDFHVHCLAEDMIPGEVHVARALARRPGASAERLEELVRRSRANSSDPDGAMLRGDLERAGVREALIIGLDWGLLGRPEHATGPEAHLEWAEAVVAEHDPFFRFAFCVDPRRSNAQDLVRSALAHPWVPGIKLYPPTGFSATDPICDVVYEAAIETGAFVIFHTGRSTFPFELERGRLEQYSVVQRRYPSLRIVLGHGGFPFWGEHAITIASGHPHTVLEVSGWNRLMGQRDHELTAFLQLAFRELGPGRILWGSDHLSGPHFSGEKASSVGAWRERFEVEAGAAGVRMEECDALARRLLHGT